MQEVIYTCDRCKKNTKEHKISVWTGVFASGMGTDVWPVGQKVDTCNLCRIELAGLIGEWWKNV